MQVCHEVKPCSVSQIPIYALEMRDIKPSFFSKGNNFATWTDLKPVFQSDHLTFHSEFPRKQGDHMTSSCTQSHFPSLSLSCLHQSYLRGHVKKEKLTYYRQPCFIFHQIEFYFGDANLSKDRFMKQEITKHPEGCKYSK